MKPTELENLTPGIYLVRINTTQGQLDSRGFLKRKPGKLMRRRFYHTETRFGSIPCAVFSSRLTRRGNVASVVSVPHYDILEATPEPAPEYEKRFADRWQAVEPELNAKLAELRTCNEYHYTP